MTVIHSPIAFNSARASENPMHNDEAARKLGYRAGMVAGVDMYGYMTYAAVKAWGHEWLSRGAAECQLLKPVFEGDRCDIALTSKAEHALNIALSVGSEQNASAQFRRHADAPRPRLESASLRDLPPERPAASSTSLAVGTVLGTIRRSQTNEQAAAFLVDIRDDLPIYRERALVHPGFLLRLCNFVFSQNVKLGPWIHTSSVIENFDAVPVGATIDACGTVVANYEKRGHRFAEIEILLVIDQRTVASKIRHIAIYAPRTQ